MNTEVGPHGLTALGIGAVVVVLQLFVARCPHHSTPRAVDVAAAAGAIAICTALLLTGHLGLRMRAARHESLDSLLLHDRCAAVSCEPCGAVPSRHRYGG